MKILNVLIMDADHMVCSVWKLLVVILLLPVSILAPKLLRQELGSRLHRLVIVREVGDFILKRKRFIKT